MKAIIECNLDDQQDRMAHQRCLKALDLCLALHEMENRLRTIIKYSEDDVQIAAAEEVRKQYREILDEYDISLDTLID